MLHVWLFRHVNFFFLVSWGNDILSFKLGSQALLPTIPLPCSQNTHTLSSFPCKLSVSFGYIWWGPNRYTIFLKNFVIGVWLLYSVVFLLYNWISSLYTYIPSLSSLPAIPPLSVITEHGAELPVRHSSFPLASVLHMVIYIYFKTVLQESMAPWIGIFIRWSIQMTWFSTLSIE